MGQVFAMKSTKFNPQYNSKVLKLLVQVKEGSTTIDLMQFPFTFGEKDQFSIGINKIYYSNRITIEAYVWDSDNIPYSEKTILELQTKDKPVAPKPEELPIVTAPAPEPTVIELPVTVEPVIVKPVLTDRMVNQTIGTFEIIDGRVIGEITYSITTDFNSYYYNKPISSFIQIKSETDVPLVVKENKLNFTQTERTETIKINESSGNFTTLIIEFFVWKSATDSRPLSSPKRITVKQGTPSTVNPAAIEAHHDSLLGAVKGIFIGTLALSLLASRGK